MKGLKCPGKLNRLPWKAHRHSTAQARQQHDLQSHPKVPLGTGLMGIQPGTGIWDQQSSWILNRVGAPGLQ